MCLETWDWDDGESDGYNHLAALEITLVNFKIIHMDDTCDATECRDFSRKWTNYRVNSLAEQVIKLQKRIDELERVLNSSIAVGP